MAPKKDRKTTVLQMSKKQGNASKKPKADVKKTTLENPFSVKLPEIAEDLENNIKSQLELCCSNLSLPILVPPWKKVLKLKGEERTQYRQQYKKEELEKLLDSPDSISRLEMAKEARSYLIFGYNAVMRALEQNKIAGILLKKDVTPVFLGETFVPGCVSKGIPLVALGGLDDILKREDMLGVKHSIMVLGLKSSVKESTCRFFPLYSSMEKTLKSKGEIHPEQNSQTTVTDNNKGNEETIVTSGNAKEEKVGSPLSLENSTEENTSKEDKTVCPLLAEISCEKTSKEDKAESPLPFENSSMVNISKGSQVESRLPMDISPWEIISLESKVNCPMSSEISSEQNTVKENNEESLLPVNIFPEERVLSAENSSKKITAEENQPESLLTEEVSLEVDASKDNKAKCPSPIKIDPKENMKQNTSSEPEDMIAVEVHTCAVEQKVAENDGSKLSSNEGTLSKYKLTAEEIKSYHLKRPDKSKRMFIPETKKVKRLVVEEKEDVILFGPSEGTAPPVKKITYENRLRPQVKPKVSRESLEESKPVGFKFDFNIDAVGAESTTATELSSVRNKRSSEDAFNSIPGKGVQERKEKAEDFSFEFFLDTEGDHETVSEKSVIPENKKTRILDPAEEMIDPVVNTRISPGKGEMDTSTSTTVITHQGKETRANIEGKENQLQYEFFIDTEGELGGNTHEGVVGNKSKAVKIREAHVDKAGKRKFIDTEDTKMKKKKKNTVLFPYTPAQIRRVKNNPNRKSNKKANVGP